MNRYKILFSVIGDEGGLGDYTALVEAESVGQAERKAARQLKEANLESKNEYLMSRFWDLGPVEEESPS